MHGQQNVKMLQIRCFILKCNPGSAYYIQYSKKNLWAEWV